MECKDLNVLWWVLAICVTSTSTRFVNDTQIENSSEKDYGTQNPGQQLSKDPSCDCEWRYLKHYEAKGCRPVYEEKPRQDDKGKLQCTCPWRFDCSQADEINADENVCIYKKHVYPVGSKIPTTNPCEACSCTTDYFTQAATITCTTTECPSVYSQTPLPEGCHYVYKESQCCPTSVECPANQKENTYKVPICEYKGKMYYEGEQIYPDEDPCLICLCNQNWTGVNSSTCRQHDCMLERDSRKLKQGCIPIYHEKTCCPIDYHCADDDFDFKANRGANFKSDDDEDEMCHFEGRYYPVGHVLDIKHPTHCVTCTCKTPPDFTCIHSSCPPPPNGDYANCRAVYKPNACCPDYKCHDKKGPSCPDPICQGTNCWLDSREDGCAVCRCKSRCVPCPDMCRPENPKNPCSGCICQINATAFTQDTESIKKNEEKLQDSGEDSLQILIQECKKMQCTSDERCMLVDKKCKDEPCLPVPQCEKVSFGCGQKTCPVSCEDIGSYEGGCPICYCKKEIKEAQYKLTCHVQSCEENCVLTGRDEDGCPLCKCPQGNLEERACAESYCKGYNCTMTVNSLGCAECRCQLSCKPRECPIGCDMDLDVPKDSGLECGCTCKNSTTAMEYILTKPVPQGCQPLPCQGLNCTVIEDQSGCPTCSCKTPCPEPECQEGCQIEKDVKEPGRCPGCICKLSRSARDNEGKECPPPTCLGYNCSVITGADGCQKCLCESPCEVTPQCPSHCKLETDVPEGRCRGCICSFGENSDSETPSEASTDHGVEVEPERREDLDADFIPLPGKEIVPEVDKIYLIHGEDDHEQYEGIPGYHYDGGHAYPVNGEPLETLHYNSDKIENHEEGNDYHHDIAEYDDEMYEAEEKTFGEEDNEKCAQKNCPEGQRCVIRRLQCIRTPCPTIPVCIDVEPRCPIPMCSIGCMVMKWDDEVCPSCFCGIIRGAEGRVCPRTRCMGRRCYNVIGDDGCPTCKCDSICIPPNCNNGCWIETEPAEGKCPTCQCPSRSTVIPPIIPASPTAEVYGMKQHYSSKAPTNPFASYHCPTPHCNGYNCSLIRGSDGCQKCVCDSPCAPCPHHCVKTKTLSEGRCPICDCTGSPVTHSEHSRQCPVVDCSGASCRKVRDNDGCYTCICDPKCAIPKCDPGCEVLTNVPPGQCPGCVCRVTVVQAVVNRPKNCPNLQCSDPNCHVTRGSDGCLQCVCDACPPPKCDPGCELQRDVAQGECPTCVCPTYNDDDEDLNEEPYCPNLFCADYGCTEIPGPAGCPICMCDPICTTPVCEPGCQVVTNKHMGKCPVCICSSPLESDVSLPNTSVQTIQSGDNIKNVQHPYQQEQQQQHIFSGLVEPVIADDEPSISTLHTTVTVDLGITEEETSTTEEITESTTEMTTTTEPTTTTCPPPVCSGLRCNFEIAENGCEVCKCRRKCPPPKCQGNCYPETNAPSHRCPGCVCPSNRRKPTAKP